MKKSENLIFGKPDINDFQRFYYINADPDTNLYNPAGAMNYERAKNAFENILKQWDINSFGSWKICEIQNPDFVIGFGGISYMKYGEETKLNLGYRFDKEYWGKGYATELAKSALSYAFTELNFNEVYALVRPKHTASIRVLEKCKMNLFDKLEDVPNDEKSLVYKIVKS